MATTLKKSAQDALSTITSATGTSTVGGTTGRTLDDRYDIRTVVNDPEAAAAAAKPGSSTTPPSWAQAWATGRIQQGGGSGKGTPGGQWSSPNTTDMTPEEAAAAKAADEAAKKGYDDRLYREKARYMSNVGAFIANFASGGAMSRDELRALEGTMAAEAAAAPDPKAYSAGIMASAAAAAKGLPSGGGPGGMSQSFINAQFESRDRELKQIYATKADGNIDFTRLTDGRASGLDAQGRPPYMNDGSLNPEYTGPKVPGQVGVPDARHAPEWSGMYQEQASQSPYMLAAPTPKYDANGNPVLDSQGKPVMEQLPQLDATGKPIPNPKYDASYTGWHRGDTPPAETIPLTPQEAADRQKLIDSTNADIGKLDKYIGNLEGALKTTTDPKKRAEIQTQLDTYRKRRTDYQARVTSETAAITGGNPNPAWQTGGGAYDPGSWTPQYDESGALMVDENGMPIMSGPGAPGTASPYASAVSGVAKEIAGSAQGVDKATIDKAAKYLDNLVVARAHAKTDAEKTKLDQKILEWSRRISDYRSR
jgi:hypothetical protein